MSARVLAVLMGTTLFVTVVGITPAFAAVPTWTSGQYAGVLRNVPFTIPIAVASGAPLTAMSVVTAPANVSGFALANVNLTAGTADMVGTYTAAPANTSVSASIRATNSSGNSSNLSYQMEAYTCSWASGGSPASTTTVFDANQSQYVTGTQAGYNQPVTGGVTAGSSTLLPTCSFIRVPGLGAATLTLSNPFSGIITPNNNDNSSAESNMNAGCGIVAILATGNGNYSGSNCNGSRTVPAVWANGGTLSLSIGSQSDKGDTNLALTQCPPSQAAVNAGLVGCTITGSSGSTSLSWNFTNDTFLYNGQNLPQQATAALATSTVLAGTSVGVSGGTNWWGNSAGSPLAGTGHTQSGSYYSIPAPGVFIGTTRGTAIPATSSTVAVGPASYACGQASSSVPPNPCTLTQGALSGSFVVPNSLAPGNYHVYIDEPNTTPLIGNGPNDSYQTARGTNRGTVESDTPITIGSAPSITSAATTTFTTGSAGSFNVTTSASPTASLSKTGTLPSGVTFTDNGDGTATIAGTPAGGTGGSYPITITASNGLGTNAQQSFTLVVNQPPAITSASTATFSVGSAGSFVVTTSGNPPPGLSRSGSLPSGVTFTDNGDGTATIAGTPASGTAANYPITITANNSVSPNATQSFTLVVNQAPAITSAASTTFTTNVAGSFNVIASARPDAALSEVGALPSGVTFTDNGDGTATIAGSPATSSGGLYQLAITASNGVGADAHQSFSLSVNEAPTITSGASATFTVGSAGSAGVTTTGYPAPVLSATGLPSGVTLTDNGDGTATISGTPDSGTGGVHSVTITAANSTLPNAQQTFTLTVNETSAITSANSKTLTVGTVGSFTVTTSGYPTASLSQTGTLPTGVNFTDNGNGTATLSGTPGAGTGGVYNLGLTSSNGIGADAQQAFTLTVNQAPAITSVASVDFAQGSAESFTVTSSGFPTASLSRSGALPTGVTFTDNGDGTATLAGTAAVGTAGVYPITFTASNGIGSNANQSFTLTVISAPQFTSAATTTFTAGTPGTFDVTVDGVPAPSVSKTGTLPAGVTFVDNGDGTATLSGTPATGTGGIYPLALTASNGVGTNGHQAFTLTVNESPVITSGNSATFTANGPESFVVTTTGEPAPALSETGALPAGVTFVDHGDGTASLAGTPGALSGGVYPLTITASNGVGTDDTQSFTLTVIAAPAITSAATTTFTVGTPGSFNVTSSANPASALSETGALPSGVTFVDNGGGNATLAGTPDALTGGVYQITINATNGNLPDAHQSFTLTVEEAPAITSAAATTFTVGSAGSFAVTTTGYPDPALSKTGALPSGVSFTDNGDGTATLAGTPAATTGGVYPITVTAANGVGSNDTQSFTLTVNQAPAVTSAATTTFVVGTAGSFVVQTSGNPTSSVSRTGGLPSGVTFTDNGNGTATIAGTPATGTAGDYPLTLTAANGVVPDAHQSFTLRIGQPAVITSAPGAVFVVGHASSFTVTTTGFPSPTITAAPAMPAGVTFHDNHNGTATISGTPSHTGSNTFTITASNGIGPAVHQTFVLLDGTVPAITSVSSGHFHVGVPGSLLVKTTGFPKPTITRSGTLPAGVTFHDNHNGTATLAGTPGPRSAGTYVENFTAANGVGSNTHQAFTLIVDTVASVSVGNAGVAEGDTFADHNVLIPITLSKPAATAVTVKYRLAGLTATGGLTGGNGIDFRDNAGQPITATIPAGAVQVNVGVRVQRDQTGEADETFAVTLEQPSGGYILGRSVGTGTIYNDDIDPYTRVSVGDATVVEGNTAGGRSMQLRLTLSKPLTFDISAQYTVQGLTATRGTSSAAPADFGGPLSGSVTVPLETVNQVITIPIYGDARIEPNETFRVTITHVSGGARIGRSTAIGTILTDD